jgi:hypothetical protein
MPEFSKHRAGMRVLEKMRRKLLIKNELATKDVSAKGDTIRVRYGQRLASMSKTRS